MHDEFAAAYPYAAATACAGRVVAGDRAAVHFKCTVCASDMHAAAVVQIVACRTFVVTDRAAVHFKRTAGCDFNAYTKHIFTCTVRNGSGAAAVREDECAADVNNLLRVVVLRCEIVPVQAEIEGVILSNIETGVSILGQRIPGHIVRQIDVGGVVIILDLGCPVPRRPRDAAAVVISGVVRGILTLVCIYTDGVVAMRRRFRRIGASDASALTHMAHSTVHRHRATPNSRFQIFMVSAPFRCPPGFRVPRKLWCGPAPQCPLPPPDLTPGRVSL